MPVPYKTELLLNRPNYLGSGEWRLSGLTAVTVLFGKNGSGKSKLLRAWRDQDPDNSHYVVPERAGEMENQPNFLQQQLTSENRRVQASANFVGEYRRNVVARIQAYFAARGDYRGKELRTQPDELEELVSLLLPDFTLTLSGTAIPPYSLRRTLDETAVHGIGDLSSGETQILTLGLDVLTIAGIWDVQEKATRILLIDEPDAHIHPDLQVRFADFLIRVASRFHVQVAIATHSTTLLSAIGQFAKETASVLYLDRSQTDFVAQPFNQVLRELSACLGGHALMGPLFGSPLVLVEGDDDYRIWSQVPRYHQVSFAVIPCGGGDTVKHYQRSLEKVFAALREQGAPLSGFALLDNDKPKPVADEHTPQNHIRYIQLACHESENLFLTDGCCQSNASLAPAAHVAA